MRFKTEALHSKKLKGENKLPIESYCPAVFRARSLTALCWLAGEMLFNSFGKKERKKESSYLVHLHVGVHLVLTLLALVVVAALRLNCLGQ